MKAAVYEQLRGKLHTYRKHAGYRGDRHIGYLALQALASIKLAKAAVGQGSGGA